MKSNLQEEHWRASFGAGDREAGLRLAELLHWRGEHGYAEEVLRRAGRGSDAVAARASLALGFSLAKRGYLEEAREALTTAERQADAKEAPDVLLNLAARWAVLGRGRDAEAAYRAVIEHAPRSAERAVAVYRLAHLLRDAGDTRASIVLLRRAVEESAEDLAPVAKLALGRSLEGRAYEDEREALYREVIASDHPDCAPEAALGLADLLADRGADEEAAELLELVVGSEHPEWAPAASRRLENLERGAIVKLVRLSAIPDERRTAFFSYCEQLHEDVREHRGSDLIAGGGAYCLRLDNEDSLVLLPGTSDRRTMTILHPLLLQIRGLVSFLATLLRGVCTAVGVVARVLVEAVSGACVAAGLRMETASEHRLSEALVRHGLTQAEAARAVALWEALARRKRRRKDLWIKSVATECSYQQQRRVDPPNVALTLKERLLRSVSRWSVRAPGAIRWTREFGRVPSWRCSDSAGRSLLRSTFGGHIAMSAPGTGKSLLALHVANVVQHRLTEHLQRSCIDASPGGLKQPLSCLELDEDDPGVKDFWRCQTAIDRVIGLPPGAKLQQLPAANLQHLTADRHCRRCDPTPKARPSDAE